MTMFKGKTSDAQSPLLGAKDWTKGMKLEGTVSRSFDTQNGTCFEVTLKTPTKLRGNLEKKFSIGALKGFHMALNAAGIEELRVNDRVIIECTGTTETNKGNPRVNFNVAVDRPE
jgi:hypothetical protein